MKTLLTNGFLYLNHGFEQKDLLLEDGIISEIGDGIAAGEAEVIDLAGRKVVPGFFDVHTHGAVNVDVNAASAEDLESICRFFASKGVTSWLCSVLTDTRADACLY